MNEHLYGLVLEAIQVGKHLWHLSRDSAATPSRHVKI